MSKDQTNYGIVGDLEDLKKLIEFYAEDLRLEVLIATQCVIEILSSMEADNERK